MKILTLSVVLFLSTLAVIGAGSADAQTTRRLNATPKAFQVFFAKFKAAVTRRDKAAVAAMTSFPFEYGWDAGDEGTYNRREFLAQFGHIFGGSRNLFAQRNPKFYSEDSSSYSLTNEENASHFGFEKRGNTYKFTSFIVEP